MQFDKQKGGKRLYKLIIFIGESGSGKTTLIKRLIKKYPNKFKKIVTCTSRTMRNGEIEGVDYHFLPEKYFTNNSSLVLKKKTVEGIYYGTKKSDLFSNDCHLLLTLRIDGVKSLLNLGFSNVLIVHISISNDLKVKRMKERGDTEEMILSRLLEDLENRSEINFGNSPVIKLDAIQKTEEQIDIILKHIENK